MKAKFLLYLTIISMIFAKKIRFLDSVGEIAGDVATMVDLIKTASSTGTSAMLGHVGMIVDGLATIVTTFKNSYSDVLVDKKQGIGFSELVGKVEYDFNVGYRDKGFNFWMEELKTQFFIPEKYKQDFYLTLGIASYAEEDTLFDSSFVFNKTEPDPNDPTKNVVSYLNVMVYHYTDKNRKKFNAIITSAEAKIKLFPNKLVYRESKSIAGGIKQTSTIHSKWENRDLTTDDVDKVVQFLQAQAYKELARVFNIKYDTRY